MSAIKNLLTQIVDYAGLFPPAKLPIDEVVQNYEDYLASDARWMLARLIVPASRLTELEDQPVFANSDHRWKISALVPPVDSPDNAFTIAMASIEAFNQRHHRSGLAIADTIEIKCGTVELVRHTIDNVPTEINAFLEVPHNEDPNQLLSAVAVGGDNIFAKIRTGGMTSELIPPAKQVARFIACCAKHDLGFKATAGLHHPICGSYRLTYEEDADFGNMFGFLNVFIAAAFAFNGASEDVLIGVLQESSIGNFDFKEETIGWNDHRVSRESVADLRKLKAISFGSCSFTEPTEELLQSDSISV